MMRRNLFGFVISVGLLLTGLLAGFEGQAEAAPLLGSENELRFNATPLTAPLLATTGGSGWPVQPELALPAAIPPLAPLPIAQRGVFHSTCGALLHAVVRG